MGKLPLYRKDTSFQAVPKRQNIFVFFPSILSINCLDFYVGKPWWFTLAGHSSSSCLHACAAVYTARFLDPGPGIKGTYVKTASSPLETPPRQERSLSTPFTFRQRLSQCLFGLPSPALRVQYVLVHVAVQQCDNGRGGGGGGRPINCIHLGMERKKKAGGRPSQRKDSRRSRKYLKGKINSEPRFLFGLLRVAGRVFFSL